jgi:hypothetical protein
MIVIKIKNNSSKNLVQCVITKDLKQISIKPNELITLDLNALKDDWRAILQSMHPIVAYEAQDTDKKEKAVNHVVIPPKTVTQNVTQNTATIATEKEEEKKESNELDVPEKTQEKQEKEDVVNVVEKPNTDKKKKHL